MPIDERRRDAITAAVGAYNEANLLTPLPRNAARLLAAMFPTGDLYQGSLEIYRRPGLRPAAPAENAA
jgi:hypothetical protein